MADVDYTVDEDNDGTSYDNVANTISKVGVIREVADNGAETTDVFK